MGFEPTTPTLARLCSTPELHPRSRPTLALLPNPTGSRLKAPFGVLVDRPSDVYRPEPTTRATPMTRIKPLTDKPLAGDRGRFFAKLAELGIASTTVEHPPMFTVEQSRALRETIPGAHTKNLFLIDKEGRVALVVAKDDTRVDLKRLAARLGFGRLSFGKPELLADLLGVIPGSVTPYALINDTGLRLRVVIDEALLAFAEVNCHPLENTATTRLGTADLLRFIRATGHEPLVLSLS
jgi:Ala-tRNA(Pro) deacylase